MTAFEVVVLLLLPFHILARRSSPGIATLLGVVAVLEILRTNGDPLLPRLGVLLYSEFVYPCADFAWIHVCVDKLTSATAPRTVWLVLFEPQYSSMC